MVVAALFAVAGCAPQLERPGHGPGPHVTPHDEQPSGLGGRAPIGTVHADDPRILDVLTFNAALLPEVVASTGQAWRAAVMAPHLTGYDVLVLQELFVDSWREGLLEELAPYYPYRTAVVGEDGARGNPLRQDGGVVILSRWPIVSSANLTFGAVCSGTDCLADKGVAYAAVLKGDRRYHVFGTHAQSVYGFGVAGVRARQFALWRSFLDGLAIPADEPVLLTGDLNVDAYTPELDDMLTALSAVRPPTVGPLAYTWDPALNALAGGGSEWLDYVLYAADHHAPAAAWNRAVALREGDRDLSDHFAVWGRVVMPR